ncbi:MAG: thioredoxin protein, partial [Deinococcus sp.]|nr:thioredoxin protein [Deinococcus sp.]
PVLQDRPGGGTAYVCVGHTCDLPTRDPETLRRQLTALEALTLD